MSTQIRGRGYIHPQKGRWRFISIERDIDPEFDPEGNEEGIYVILQRSGKLGAKGRKQCLDVKLNLGAAEMVYRSVCKDARDAGYQPAKNAAPRT